MKKHIVTIVDYGETCDGKARVLRVCDTKDEAVSFVREDMDDWYKHNNDDVTTPPLEIDCDRMSVRSVCGDRGCEWNIEEVEI